MSHASWHLPFPPHSQVGGVFVIGFLTALLGVVLLLISIPVFRPFFTGQVIEPEPALAEQVRGPAAIPRQTERHEHRAGRPGPPDGSPRDEDPPPGG